jgi:hypothetical protein
MVMKTKGREKWQPVVFERGRGRAFERALTLARSGPKCLRVLEAESKPLDRNELWPKRKGSSPGEVSSAASRGVVNGL